jgi:hypothetical protein
MVAKGAIPHGRQGSVKAPGTLAAHPEIRACKNRLGKCRGGFCMATTGPLGTKQA